MKKRILLILVLVFAMIFTACAPQKPADSTDKKPDDANTQTQGQEEKKDDENKQEGKTITAKELFNNLNARYAFAYAIDKSFIETNVLADGSLGVDFFVTDDFAFNDKGEDFRDKYPNGFLHYDVEKAKEHWAKAKEELGFDTIEISFLTYDQEGRKKVSEYVQAQLMQNLEGLTVVLDVQPFKNKLNLASHGKYELEMGSWGPDYSDPMTFLDMLVTNAPMNYWGYSNSKYDELVMSSKTGELTKDPAKRWEALQDAEKIILEDDAVVIPLYQSGYSYLHRPGVKGLIQRSLPPEYTFTYATTDYQEDGKDVIRMISFGDIPNLDPNQAGDVISFNVIGAIYEGLVEIDGDNVVQPKIAKSWDVSEDGLKYTFHLRDDAKWTNGDPVTAHDFVFSWRRLADPATGSDYSFMVETMGLKNAGKVQKGELPLEELGVKALDDYTLECELEVPVPYFLKLTYFGSFVPINEKFYNEHKEEFGSSMDHILSNGPYVMKSIEPGYGFTFAKSDSYYNKDIVKNDEVRFRVVKDTAAGVNLYETSEIDRVQLSGEFVSEFLDRPDYLNFKGSRITYLRFNLGFSK